MPDVGDATTPELIVYPYDGTTAPTLTVRKPDGTTATPTLNAPTTVTTVIDGATVTAQKWTTAAVVFTLPNRWVLDWNTVGTGFGQQSQVIDVDPLPSFANAPAWTPRRRQVAKYIPRRTVVGASNGYGTLAGTFTDLTHPTGSEVDDLIAAAVLWVQVRVGVGAGDLAAGLGPVAAEVAAQRAAGLVELTYPDNRDDLSTAQLLLDQAKVAREELWAANVATTGTDVEDPSANLMPMWSFPRPDPWGDTIFT